MAGQAVGFRRDPAGRETGRVFSAGASLDRVFDGSNCLGSLVMNHPAQADHAEIGSRSVARSFEYRAGGSLVRITDDLRGASRRFSLDGAGRVTHVAAPTWTESYGYDALGRIGAAGTQRGAIAAAVPAGAATHPSPTAATDPIASAGTREYAGTRVIRAGTVHYGYDGLGRVVTRSQRRLSTKPLVWQFSYDFDARLVAASSSSGENWTYSYDPMGRRVSKQRLDATGGIVEQTLFSWEGERLAEEVRIGSSATEPAVSTWENLPGTYTPIAQIASTGPGAGPSGLSPDRDDLDTRFFAIVTDLIGTPTEMVTADGVDVVWSNAQRSLWGLELFRSPSFRSGDPDRVNCPLRFPGQYEDTETGLSYNRHRYYDPICGRYLTADPLGLEPALDPQGYVLNPNDWSDPLGLTPCPNKRGPKPFGEGPHNQKIKEIADWVTDGDVVAGGQRLGLPEEVVPTPLGTKSARRPDITVRRPDGSRYGINVGRQERRTGLPVKR